MADLPGWAQDMVREARVGHLATASEAGVPHVMPVCFVLEDGCIYSVIDEKPKSGRRLLRLRNIEATGQAALVVDRYDEDWTRLAWVLARGPATVMGPAAESHSEILLRLRDKYVQYRSMTLDDAEIVVLTAERWTAWRAG